MLSILLTVALSLTTLTTASTVQNYRRDSALLRLPVAALNVTGREHVQKRQDVLITANTERGTLYLVTFSLGTPPQAVAVALDTGSSDTWVDPTCSAAGSTKNVDLCNGKSRYNPAASSTSTDTGHAKQIPYTVGSANIEFFKDNVAFGGATVHAQQFGVASSTTGIPVGLLGIGPGIELTLYPTIIDQLALQGITNSRAFSLDLRGVDSPEGAIIFGGIDTKKYIGPLERRPIIPKAQAPDNFDRYWIYMTSVGITKPGAAPKLYSPSSNNPQGQAVFLDSGATFSRLPTPLFNAIVADFPGATLDLPSGLYTVPCSVADLPGTVDFGFGNTIIHVPYREFLWFAESNLCALGVVAEDKAPVLGDSFLRAAFVVYDQDNQNLFLAQAANCGTNLVPIGKGPDAVPSISGACAASSTSSSTSSSSSVSSSSTSSSSSVSSSSTSSSSSVPSSSTSLSSSVSSSSSSLSTSVSISSSSSSTSESSSPSPSLSTPLSSASPSTSTSNSSPPTVSKSTNSTSSPSPLTSLTSSSASTTTSIALTLSTVYATKTYTVSSCPPTVQTACPYGQVTTETISLYTTYCPVSPSPSVPVPATTPQAAVTTTSVIAITTVPGILVIPASFVVPGSSYSPAPAPTDAVVVVQTPVTTSGSGKVASTSATPSTPAQFKGTAAVSSAVNVIVATIALAAVFMLF